MYKGREYKSRQVGKVDHKKQLLPLDDNKPLDNESVKNISYFL